MRKICTMISLALVLLASLSSFPTCASAFFVNSELKYIYQTIGDLYVSNIEKEGLPIFSPFSHHSNPYTCLPQRIRNKPKISKAHHGLRATKKNEESDKKRKKKQNIEKNTNQKGNNLNLLSRFFSKKQPGKEKSQKKNDKGVKSNKVGPTVGDTIDTQTPLSATLAIKDIDTEFKDNYESSNGNKGNENKSKLKKGLSLGSVIESAEENLLDVRGKISEIRRDSNKFRAQIPQDEVTALNQIKSGVEQARKERELEEKRRKEKMKLEAQQKLKEREQIVMENEKRKQERLDAEKKRIAQKERQNAILKAATDGFGDNKDNMMQLEDNNQRENNTKRNNFDPKSLVIAGFGNAKNFVTNTWDSVFSDDDDEEWIVVCPKTRISPGEVVPIVAGGIDILLIASKDAKKLHAIANSCPHLGTPLETGPIERRPVEAFQYGSDITPLNAKILSAPKSASKNGISTAEDGCEECIVCPLHQTAFALESGEVRGEWCPYPPVIGKVMGVMKQKEKLVKFAVRTRGKNIEVRLNTSLNKKKD